MGAAVLQGAPATTADIDILYLVSEENFPRLEAALTELEAEFRSDLMNRRLRPNMTHLRDRSRPIPASHDRRLLDRGQCLRCAGRCHNAARGRYRMPRRAGGHRGGAHP